MRTLTALLLLLALAACRTGPPRPVELDPSDVCAHCKMAISEKRYAAQLIDLGGNARKFDDIGCMLRSSRERAAAWFVMDYQQQQWIDARQAWFVTSKAIPSPMASGIAAVGDKSRAEDLARKYQGHLSRFEDLAKP